MIGHGEGVEAALLGSLGDLDDVLTPRVRADLRQPEGDLHGGGLRGARARAGGAGAT